MNFLTPNPNWARLPLFDRRCWAQVRFGDVVENVNETERNPVQAGIDRFIGLEHLEPGSLHIQCWGNVADGTTFTRRCRPGQVLFGKRRAYQRKVAVAEFDAVVSGDIYVLAPKDGRLLPELLPFVCLSERFYQHAVGTSAGSLSPRTNWRSLTNFEFDLPPLDRQQRIAEILWALDKSALAYDSLVKTLAEVRRVQIDGLFPAPCHAALDLDFTRLDHVASMQNGRPFPSAKYQENGVRLIRPGNLGSDGKIDWSPTTTVNLPEEYLESNRGWFIEANQVLINLTAQSLEDGFIGRVCITGTEDSGLLNQRIGRFFLIDEVLPKFFFRCLQTTRFRELVENRCEGSKIRHLYFRHFEDFPIPILGKERQQEIIEKLDVTEYCLRAAQQAKSILVSLGQTLSNTIVR